MTQVLAPWVVRIGRYFSAVIVWIGIAVTCGAAFCDGLVKTAASPAGATVAAS